MWIFSKYGFFSVTQNAQRKDLIQIRARAEQDLIDLKEAFPQLERNPIIETPQADYRWRIVCQRWKWNLIGASLTADIDYGNFKGKIATIPTQREKGPMLHDIWSIHHAYQQRKSRPDPYAGHPELFYRDRLWDERDLDELLDEPDEPQREPFPGWPEDAPDEPEAAGPDDYASDLPEPPEQAPEPEPEPAKPAKRRKAKQAPKPEAKEPTKYALKHRRTKNRQAELRAAIEADKASRKATGKLAKKPKNP